MARRKASGSRGGERWTGSHAGSFLKRMINRPATNSRNNALLWGIAWLIIGAIASWHFQFVPTSMIGYTTSGYIPLIWHVAIALTVWVSYGVVFFAFGVMRNRRTGFIEAFGRMLFAHWPITLLLVPGIFFERIVYATFMSNPGAAYQLYPYQTVIMTVVAVVVGLWTIYWGYQAFSRATQRPGFVTLLCYLIATPLSYYLSKLLLTALYEGMSW